MRRDEPRVREYGSASLPFTLVRSRTCLGSGKTDQRQLECLSCGTYWLQSWLRGIAPWRVERAALWADTDLERQRIVGQRWCQSRFGSTHLSDRELLTNVTSNTDQSYVNVIIPITA